MAKDLGLDLVEISPKAVPPVCKIIDYQKFLYEQKKRDKAMKSKATKVIIKEIRFGPQTDEHDYEFKKKHAIKFLCQYVVRRSNRRTELKIVGAEWVREGQKLKLL